MSLKIIGTSHIAKQSIDEIKNEIEKNQPDIVALELDVQRASSLLKPENRNVPFMKAIRIGVKGYLFVKIGQYVQQKLGKMVGISPGSEMKTALILANQKKIDVAFIDQPITITLKKFSKGFTWKERGRFVVDIFKGIFSPKKQIENMGLAQFDLSKVPEKEIISKMVNQLKERYPSLYKTLIDDRNRYMVKKLVKLLRDNKDKKILAIVGAGHKEGMEKLLLKVEIIR